MRPRCFQLLTLFALLLTPLFGWVPTAKPSWSGSEVTVHLQLSRSGTYSDGTSPNGTALEAVRAWNDVMGRLQLSAVSDSTAPLGANNGYNNVSFSSTVFGQPFDPGVLAVEVAFVSGGKRVESDVLVNTAYTWDSYRGPRRLTPYDLRRVLIHELGHMLGLDHPDEASQQVVAVMNSTIGAQDALSQDDINGAIALYGMSTLGYRPVIVFHGGSNLTRWQGDSVAFEGGAFGSGTLAYQWLRNDVPIPGATGARLELRNLSAGDAGRYAFTVTNSAGIARSTPFQLTVTPAIRPRIDTTSGPTALQETGASIRLNFTVRDVSPPLFYTWRRNGTIIRESGWTYDTTLASFDLTNLATTDSGSYTLSVTNALGTTTSDPFTFVVTPPAAPAFLIFSASRNVAAGSSFFLSGAVVGTSPIKFAWFKDGVLIPGVTSGVLNVDHATEANAGLYVVRATNAYGTAESKAFRVTVQPPVPLRITRQPNDVLLSEQGGFSLSIDTSGPDEGNFANNRYQWYKNGQPIPNATYRYFTLSRPTPGDVGTYTVEVFHADQKVTSQPAVVSLYPGATFAPTIPLLSGRAAQTGETVLWSVVLSSDTRPQWRRNGVELPGQTNSFLKLTNVQPTDSGSYSLVATNDYGTAIRTIPLTVTDTPPLIRSFPVDFATPTGVPLTFDAELNQDGTWQSAIWQRDGQTIPGAVYYGRYNPGTIALQATAAETGSYRLAITTTTGDTIFSESVNVTVTPPPSPTLTSDLADQTSFEGTPVAFTVSTTWLARPSYQWWKDGTPVPGATRQTLEIAQMRAEDAGNYRVVLTNESGTVTSKTATLTLIPTVAPIIANHPPSIATGYGREVYLWVQTTRDTPVTSHRWYKDGVALPATGASLSFNLSPENTGRYHVVVSNSRYSTVSEIAEVSLLPDTSEPVFTLQPPREARVTAGTDVAYAIIATGAGNMLYQWRRNGVAIPGAASATLRLSPVTESMAGDYTVSVVNYLGRAESTALVLQVDPAAPPRSLPAPPVAQPFPPPPLPRTAEPGQPAATTGRLLNLSARALSRGGDDVLIAGFVVRGLGSKRLLVRGIGTTLTRYGVVDTLTNPKLTIYDEAGRLRHTIEDWRDFADREAILANTSRVGAFPLPDDSSDAAIIITLEPGNYTAHLTNPALSSARVGLAELYDLNGGAPRMINISTRARVEPGEGALIAGFAVDQGEPKRLLIRATGPAMAIFGVPDLLTDPTLEIIRSGETAPLATNNNWGDAGDPATLEAAFKQVGAFDLPRGSTDAALIVTLPPGTYTAKVTGADPTTSGNALIEVYELPSP